jgi:O-antigen ligase
MNETGLPNNDAASWLAGALVVMPFLQTLPIDFDRSGTLILLAPVLWAGRNDLVAGVAALVHGPRALSGLFALSAIAVFVSLCRAEQPAPAVVTAATWIILAVTGVIAGQCIRNDVTATRRILSGVALGAAAGTMVVWYLWFTGGRGGIPLYTHPRHLGLHTLGGAVATTALLLDNAIERRKKIFWLIVGAVVWGGLAWSGGRAPLVAVLGGLLAWFICRPSIRRTLTTMTAVQLIAGLALSLLFWTPRPELGWWHALDRTTAAVAAGSTTDLTSARSDFWLDTAKRASVAPWFGHGPDSYRFLTPKLDGQQPHNFALQLWLDLGFLGAIPLAGILALLLFRGWTRRDAVATTATPWQALLTASAIGGMLDGVFYHLLAFLPAMLAVGAVLPVGSASTQSQRTVGWPVGLTTNFAVLVVIVHSWIFYQLALAAPPSPGSAVARIVRAFPSSTFGLTRWLDAWQTTAPLPMWEWLKWAQTHSAAAPSFHIYAARVLLAQGNPAAAEEELMTARDKAHRSARPAIDGMLEIVRSLPR